MSEETVLVYLPVTKAWLRQAVIGLVLLCHSSYRGVIEFLRDLLDTRLCLGTVHNVVQAAVNRAQQINVTEWVQIRVTLLFSMPLVTH
ncbi:MAG: hypothetical protein WA970_13880 [Gammaproteobacteria bacterium]